MDEKKFITQILISFTNVFRYGLYKIVIYKALRFDMARGRMNGGNPTRIELTRVGLLVKLANHYTIIYYIRYEITNIFHVESGVLFSRLQGYFFLKFSFRILNNQCRNALMKVINILVIHFFSFIHMYFSFRLLCTASLYD